MRIAPFALLAALALAGAARTVLAEDPPAKTPAQTLVADLEAAKAAKDDVKWLEALNRVAAVYPDATDADKKPLAAAAGNALKAKSEEVKGAALDALVATKDGDVAWKAGIRGELPDEKAEAVKEFSLRVLDALKELHPDAAIAPLLNLLHKAKDPKVPAKALVALGAYERSKQRQMVFDEVVKAVRGTMPVNSKTKAASATPKWTEMEGHVVPTLNALTGQAIADLGTWFKFLDEDVKKKPALLFKTPL